MSSGKGKLKGTTDTTAHLLEWPQSRALTPPSAGEDVEQEGLSATAGGNAEWCSPLLKTVQQFLTKLNILLQHNSSITPLVIHPKQLKTCPQRPARECL